MAIIDTRLMMQIHSEFLDAIREDRDNAVFCSCSGPRGDFITAPDGIPYVSYSWTMHDDECEWYKALMTRHNALLIQSCYVNVYLNDRAYGGPEEGDWWYNTSEIIAVYPVADRVQAHILVNDLRHTDEYSNEGRRDIGSVLSEGVYRICIEWTRGESRPTGRPHYE